jgi:NAD(P)-dependent dehydrogenase (short-subunit alcohol dehydrogenase family)
LDELRLNKWALRKAKLSMSKTAIIFGSTGGIGRALLEELETGDRYDTVIGLSRGSNPPIDLLDEDCIKSAAEWVRAQGIAPSLLIVASGVLHSGEKGPEKSLSQLDPAWMLENYQVNAVGPALIAKHFLPLAPRKERVVFAALSARVGSISDNSLGGWHSYRASKAALNMLLRNIAIEWQWKNPQSIVVGLHPGTVETPLSAPFKGNPASQRLSPTQSAIKLLAVLDELELAQSGQVFAYDGSSIAP